MSAEPQNPAVDVSGPPPARNGRRSLATALLSGALGAAVVLFASGRTWMTGSAEAARGSLPVTASGQDVTALPGALALVALAALVAVFAVRGAGRLVVSALLALCGAGTLAAALAGRGDTTALDAAAAKVTSVSGTMSDAVAVTAWPLAAAAGGALLLSAGLLALVRGRTWPGMSNRYDRDGTAAAPRRRQPAAPDPDRPEDLWKALDRGEDPTEAV